VEKKDREPGGFAAPVLLRPAFERLLDSYLRARLEPSPEQTKAQEQDQAKQQEGELAHVRTVISTYAVGCQEATDFDHAQSVIAAARRRVSDKESGVRTSR